MAFCNARNEGGVRCVLGEGHSWRHRFTTVQLTDNQVRALQDLLHAHPEGLESVKTDSTHRSLERMGYVTRERTNGKWRTTLTWAGAKVAREVSAC